MSRLTLSAKARKKNTKEVRKSAKISLEERKKSESVQKKLSRPASLKQKAHSLKKHLSKRSSPQEGIENSQPAHLHHEGFLWRRTLTKQGALQRKLFTRSFLKKM